MRRFRLIFCCFLAPMLGTIAVGASAAPAPMPASRMQSAHDSTPLVPLAKVKRIIADARKIVTPNGIQELDELHIDGISQWVSIRGRDRRNPILLVLHGGPGSPDMPLAWTFESPWEDYFTVVEWDQRGTGKTYASNTETAMAPGMTIPGMTQDAAKVVEYLRKRFHKRKIFLLGHSWGSVLGVRLAQEHPHWFYAYIGVGQVVNTRKSEADGYAWALREAQTHHNAEAIRELKSIAPYPGTAPMTIQRITIRDKWEMYYGGLAWGRKDYQFAADAWKLSPEYGLRDWRAIDKGSLFSLKHLLQPFMAVDFDHVTRFDCPVILFVGAHDYTVSYKLAKQWFDKIQAPSKRLVIFADSAHMIFLEQPGRFLVDLVKYALPYARKAGDVAPGEKTTFCTYVDSKQNCHTGR
ncbi:MAG: alpha/beta fold hydrolase [Gammaproteobacteria bacterium]